MVDPDVNANASGNARGQVRLRNLTWAGVVVTGGGRLAGA